ncbi:YhcN/YlaJ family sporulation lipoprotein [Paucisalibacillus globulus]|uniref:YhcN/YlaJ family sporulation lipoprotein n=1 Tax=Paucisalibacillus globulus TaxID=351095 RepID=UPI0004280C6C|nr:YhcN/YlaJ family sporulation lipoprotein [Paucisalibacillus globulus]
MRGKIIIVITSFFLVTACGNEPEQGLNNKGNQIQNQNNTQPINYETTNEQKERLGERDKSIGELGGYKQSDQEYVNEGDKNFNAKNEDQYTSERTYLISEYLSERKEVVQSQIAETDDRVIVAVMTGNKYYPDLPEIIRRDVKQIIPDKEVVVYTDAAWWDRMRNLNSNPNDMDDNIQKDLDDFFNNE